MAENNMYTLISATPSPYARKIRIALAEKRIPFILQTEVPWDSTTATPSYNPLEKLPVLIPTSPQDEPVYESHYIFEWLEAKHPSMTLMPATPELCLLAKKIEVVCDGVCDALVLAFFEKMRDEDKQSEPWKARQMRKVAGGLGALNKWVSHRKGEFILGDSLTLADIAVGCVLGYMAVRWPDHEWPTEYPEMKKFLEKLEEMPSFASTKPSPQTMKDQIV